MEARIIGTFRSEFEAVRGPDAVLRRVAIADERPDQQFLREEFDLFALLFERAGIEARICDTADLSRAAGGGLRLGDDAIDLVYLRDTDFLLEARGRLRCGPRFWPTRSSSRPRRASTTCSPTNTASPCSRTRKRSAGSGCRRTTPRSSAA